MLKLRVVAHVFSPSTQEVEAVELPAILVEILVSKRERGRKKGR